MRLAGYCRGESGFLLLPLEHLSPLGSGVELAAFLERDCGWSAERVALLDAALALYWERCTKLSRATSAWPRPRIRNVGIAADGVAVRPFAQVLNTSTWTLYDCDLDAATSGPQLVAYLLALGDWMAMTGEVTEAPMRSAAWWISADDDACSDFGAAAARSTRPDAAALRAVADAVPWLRTLGHTDLRPAADARASREIPGTGLQVPAAIERRPLALVEAARGAAVAALEAYREAWRDRAPAVSPDAIAMLLGWLAEHRPQVVVTASGAVVWDRVDAGATDDLAALLADADRASVDSIRLDLALIDERSRAFLSALADADELPRGDASLAESGYAYVQPGRRVIAYNLHEPGMERLTGVPLPYERAMLGARTLHEWAHLADEAGWVAAAGDDAELPAARSTLCEALDELVESRPAALREPAERDLVPLRAERSAGEALAELLLARLPDYRANLVAARFMSTAERETYLRHNIRTLRYERPPIGPWRMLARYLYEYQYLLPQLGLASVDDPYGYFERCTGLGADLVETGWIDEARFRRVGDAVARVCACYAVDTSRISLPPR